MASRVLALVVMALAITPAFAQSHKTTAAKKEQPAARQESAAAGDPVVARVNGEPIFRSDLEALRATLLPQMQNEPANQLYPKLLDQRVALELVSQAARKEKLQDDPRVRKMMALDEENILQNAYFEGMLHKEITEAKLKEQYQQYLKTHPAEEEVHARHILVPTEAEAKQIIEQLKKGADFAKLASEKTTDPSGKASGGDLGYFTKKDMVPEFAKAAFALKPGQFTLTPVKTQFGWHIIKSEDRRMGKPPTYAQIAPQLARQMEQEIYTARVKQLAAASKIEVFNPDGSKPQPAPVASAPKAEAAPAAAPAAGQPQLLPFDNGTPGEPPPSAGPPTLAPATEGLGK
ncbi:MAG: peptidylprolyl isomerase [Stellaceae bacterium]